MNLNINKPCKENFNSFLPTKKGGFCSSCQAEVVDFTNMSSKDIIAFFENKKHKNTCGRFYKSQLTNYEIPTKKRSHLSFLGGFALSVITFFSFNKAKAQNTTNTKISNTASKNKVTNEKTVSVKGTVLDAFGLPLFGANVILKNTSIGVSTDLDGNFKFPQKLKNNDVLIFSFLGMLPKEIVINTSNTESNITLEVAMEEDDYILVGKVIKNGVYKSN